jgi:alcohol dehydrogenase
LGRGRVLAVTLTGDTAADTAAIRAAAGGGVHLAFDMVGQAKDASSTLAALKSLARNGRMVLMGSMQVELPITYSDMLRNNWELIGHFMYSNADYRALISLVAAGLLDLGNVQLHCFDLKQLETAIDHAAQMDGLSSTVIRFDSKSS